MTDIVFHTGVPDRLQFACRLLRKAYKQEACVAVSGSVDMLTKLDKLLWVFDDLEFIPHIHARAGAALPTPLRRTPIWLVDPGVEPPQRDVLLHLGDEPVAQCERYGKVIEVVSADPAEREAGRRRWKHYEERGHSLTHHKAGASTA